MSELPFKYKSEINSVLEKGHTLPLLVEPINQEAYRYVFTFKESNNHKPAYIQTPKRAISDSDKGKLTPAGYALSCFDTEQSAIKRYDFLKRSMRAIERSLGDALSQGTLERNDGLITEVDINGHFSFYEFYECDLSSKFVIKRSLL